MEYNRTRTKITSVLKRGNDKAVRLVDGSLLTSDDYNSPLVRSWYKDTGDRPFEGDYRVYGRQEGEKWDLIKAIRIKKPIMIEKYLPGLFLCYDEILVTQQPQDVPANIWDEYGEDEEPTGEI